MSRALADPSDLKQSRVKLTDTRGIVLLGICVKIRRPTSRHDIIILMPETRSETSDAVSYSRCRRRSCFHPGRAPRHCCLGDRLQQLFSVRVTGKLLCWGLSLQKFRRLKHEEATLLLAVLCLKLLRWKVMEEKLPLRGKQRSRKPERERGRHLVVIAGPMLPCEVLD